VTLPSVLNLVLAGITGSVGVFYLAFYAKYSRCREHLPFALLCFTVAAYDVFSAALYDATSVAQGVVWQRLQLATLGLGSALTIWFLELTTRQSVSRVGRWLIGLLVVLVPLGFVPGLTVSDTPAVKVIRWAGRDLVTYYEGQLGVVNEIGIVIVCFVYVRLVWMLSRAYRESRSPHVLVIMGGQVAYFAGLLNDGLVGSEVYDFFYVSEYAYLVVIMTMAYALLGRFVDLHANIEQLNASLERRVAEALADIKVLRGLIPICASCKKIRDDQGFWTRIEEYFTAHSEAKFSHGICPECMRALYPDFVAKREREARELGE
jgi:hypothetical protein